MTHSSFVEIEFNSQISLDKNVLNWFMWNQLRSFVLWLHEPEHVVRFQRYFGLLPIADDKSDLNLKQDAKDLNQDNQTSVHRRNVQSDQLTSRDRRDRPRKLMQDTSVLDECLEEIKHNAEQKKNKKTHPEEVDYRISSWFWYYFFQFGSALGNEIFYIVFFPTW